MPPDAKNFKPSKHPRNEQNGLLFGFLPDETSATLENESKEWKERSAAIESIEVELNSMNMN